MVRVRSNILFVTGTDTGVGKTVFTVLLLSHLRQSGLRALAIKPFSTGERTDALLLHSLQRDRLSLEEINPYHFTEPLAPWVAARRQGGAISPGQLRQTITRLAGQCDRLLVEGVGGLLVPLTEGWFVLDLIRSLRCRVLVVSANRLGTINHTLLTVRALGRAWVGRCQVVLNQPGAGDLSGRTNGAVLRRLLAPVPVHVFPHLGRLDPDPTIWCQRSCKKMKKRLAPMGR